MTGFYMMATLAFNELSEFKQINKLLFPLKSWNLWSKIHNEVHDIYKKNKYLKNET